MTDQQRKKIDKIVSIAEGYHPEGEYGDRAFDAVMAEPDCDSEEIGHRLAMEAAYP